MKLPQFEKWVKPRSNSKDLIEKEEERINGELTKMLEDGEISSELKEGLKSQGGQPPRLYGLAKVHKSSVPVQPVLSMPGSPYFPIANKVTEWLSVVPESKCQSSSKKIADQLKSIELDDGEVLISFDVVSLYTNVPVQESILDSAERLYCGEFETPPVSKEAFIRLMRLASTDVAMLTHDGYYVQKDGLAMGSPPAPLLANIWLAKKEPAIKDEAKLFERYMDDIIRTIQSNKIDGKLNEINELHNNLKFTMELEKDGEIPFLDMLLMRTDIQIESTWYCKPTDTGLVMNFHAVAPKRYKRGVVSGFVHRIHRACSTWSNFDNSLKKAKAVLEKNQYPPMFYEEVIADALKKIVDPVPTDAKQKSTDDEAVATKYTVLLQYRGFATDQFIKKLKDSKAPVQVVLTLRKLRSCLPSLKSPIPKMLRSDVVYRITCPRCQACYVGKTSRHLTSRFAEHKSRASGPVLRHMKSCEVQVVEMRENLEVLRTVIGGGFQLSIMEALFIREVCLSLNTRDEYRDHELTIKF